jgi:hypothetical protein
MPQPRAVLSAGSPCHLLATWTRAARYARAREQTWGQLGILTQPAMHPICRGPWDSARSVPAKFQVKCLLWGHLPRPCSEMRAARGQKLQNSAMHEFKNHRIQTRHPGGPEECFCSITSQGLHLDHLLPRPGSLMCSPGSRRCDDMQFGVTKDANRLHSPS